MSDLKEYIVTLHRRDDLDEFYEDMESLRSTRYNCMPERAVECYLRRPTSRNTHYWLTEEEAAVLRQDLRIRAVELRPQELGIKVRPLWTQTSTEWNKSNVTSSSHRNWALLRCTEDITRIGWGSDATVNQSATITINEEGRNVDVIIVDGHINPSHPEFAINSDGTGGSRVIQLDWHTLTSTASGLNNDGGVSFLTSSYVYTPYTGTATEADNNHGCHVAGTVAGNTQGWARSANIYNISPYSTNPNGLDELVLFDYIRAFHNTKSINPATGRRNPTICNHSWGYGYTFNLSVNPVLSLNFRGTTYMPVGTTSYTGFSGVCTADSRVATLVNFENAGNRITTTGTYTPPSGSILTKPASWNQTGQQATLTIFSNPDASYELTVQGPADIDLINSVGVDASAGTMSLTSGITVKQGTTVVQSYTDGPYSATNGGTIETSIRPNRLSLPDNAVYTITFDTTLDTSSATNPIVAVAMSLSVATETLPVTASVMPLATNLLGSASLTPSTTPNGFGDNDEGYWTLNLPFNIDFLGTSYSTIYVGTNSYITFGGGSTSYSNLGASNPNLPKIMWSSDDNSVQRIYYGVEGTAPNRTYRVRIEGSSSASGTIGSPTMVAEYTFYENTPAQIDLQLGVNGRKTTGSFTEEQLRSYGLFATGGVLYAPAEYPALDADAEDAIADGIIMVAAASNDYTKVDVLGGQDYNNTFTLGIGTGYYHRGSSPGKCAGSICVGSVDVLSTEYKATYSNTGPRVDIFAPGTRIISSTNSGGISDPRGVAFLNKYSGTSMASPQVCGVLACILETYPNMSPAEALEYIQHYAKDGQLTDTGGGLNDYTSLQGAPNKYLFFYKQRAESGNVHPKINYKPRPSSGMVFPRPKIYKSQ